MKFYELLTRFTRVPQEGGCCGGGSRNVVGWGIPLVENEDTNRNLQVPSIENKYLSNVQAHLIKNTKCPFHVLLIVNDPTVPKSHAMLFD